LNGGEKKLVKDEFEGNINLENRIGKREMI
jgi:hypothetical protein